MSDNEDDLPNIDPPPTFEDLNERIREYLFMPENLSIHDRNLLQTHFVREVDVSNLFDNDRDYIDQETTLVEKRDLITGDIIGIEEILVDNEDGEQKISSMSRAPLPPNQSTLGTVTQLPFLPAGFEEELQKILLATDLEGIQINCDDIPGKFLGEDILTMPPGGKESVIFEEDGHSILNTTEVFGPNNFVDVPSIEIKFDVNLEEEVQSSVHLVDFWKEDKEEIATPSEPVKTDLSNTSEDDNALESELTNIEGDKIEDQIPVLNISASGPKIGLTSTEFAEVIDVSQPVPDFDKRIKDMAHTYPFELDNFQKQAILKLEEGHHVFVAAHTSAGKTVVAEYAIAMTRRDCTRAIYTSPIKALSNQKYNDFSRMFGDVGLLTGDLQINVTASCLVMTTEILRFMLYCGSDVTRDLDFVIFDEVHYINNAERGYVWEEVLILLPAHVSIVMLSATVPNTLQFADWVGRTKKRKVYVVSTLKRPIPLCHYLYTGTGGKSKHERFQIVDESGKFLLSGYNKAVEAKKSREKDFKKNFGPKGNKQMMNPKAQQTMWVAFIDHLKSSEKLPVVAFTLSRSRCDQNAESLCSIDLTTAREKSHIHSFFQRCLHRLKEPDRVLPQVIKLQRVLMSGIGIHHSGILPLLKEIVEILFQSGHVKVLFATETFAMGVNMPARTVVFDEITKFDGLQSRTLLPAEYIQMAGRAGRRGLDDTGTVIIMCKDEVPNQTELKGMMLGTPEKLSSQFRLTYGMILSLLRASTVTVEGMMKRSFREFDQIVMADSYKKQLELAEKEYTEKCSKPLPSHLISLATFYDTAASYFDILNEIMPILLNVPKILKEFVPGRVLVVSVGPYINQLALYLDSSGSRQTPYKVLILDTASHEQDSTKFNFDLDETWYRVLSYSAMYDGKIGSEDGTLEHTIMCIAPKNVIELTKITLKIESKVVIQDWEQRQMPRFKNVPVGAKCLAAVQELSRLSHTVRTGVVQLDSSFIRLKSYLAIKNGEILQTLDKMKKLKGDLEIHRKYTNIGDFTSKLAIVHERKMCERKRDKYRRLLSFESLALYPDYQRRLLVLRELDYIDDHDQVILKGRVACCMATNELIISELMFRNVFTDKTPAEIAALLSGFVFQAKKVTDLNLPPRLSAAVKEIQAIDDELSKIESKYLVGAFEGQPDRLNFGLTRVVYEWAMEKPFAEITDLTDIQEGIIVRCIQQLHVLLIDVKDGAVAVGDPKLQEKMVEASMAIKRDIVFAASLYTTQKENLIG